jgi:hypothetical protein
MQHETRFDVNNCLMAYLMIDVVMNYLVMVITIT